MIKSMLKDKKVKYGLVVLLALVLLGVTVTLAYLSKTTQAATNPFTPGEVTTNIEEEVDIAGSTIKKNPSVKNSGPSACIIRLRVSISPAAIANRVNNKQKDEITIDYDTTNWKFNGDDGFWYYQGVVQPKDSTQPLFTEITGVMDADGKAVAGMENFQITLYQEAVQTEVSIGDENVKAYDETGTYVDANAMRIWEKYDAPATVE